MNNELLEYCPWDDPTFLFFSENVPEFLFYSHVIALVSVLFFSIFLLHSKEKNLSINYLLLLFIPFSYWVVIDNIIWASNNPSLVLFLWNTQIIVEPMIYALAFYTVYTFIYKKIPNFKTNLVLFLLSLPILLLANSNLSLIGINVFDCDAIEGPLATFYVYFIQILTITAILFLGIRHRKRKVSLFFSLAIIAFLISFTSGNIIGSVTGNWDLAQFGLFGMPLFIGILTYLIAQFKMYNTSIIAAQALIIVEWILIGSLLLVVQTVNSKIVASITLVTSVVLGLGLLRSVKKEVKQREEIERLAESLERTNERLKVIDKQKSEFVSIASHQLRSPLTAIRGYVSMLQEGSFGELPEAAREPMKRVDESSRFMATSIDDFLNVSRIESGNMKYEYTNVDLVGMAKEVVDDLQTDAEKRNLVLQYRTNLQYPNNTVYADHGKLMQILHNLINNALKYTREGSVTVYVTDNPDKKTLSVEFVDTGIGMSKETLDKLFGKFTRAKIASSANIMGTGLGLFVAREMARAMKGDVTAHSDGEGKGSRFVFTMPYEPTATPSGTVS